MKVKSLRLKNFKRFTDLTFQGIPETAKLVLLIGSNGSGKSCVFDGLEVLNLHRHGKFVSDTDPYYSKKGLPFEVIADFGGGFAISSKLQSPGSGAKVPILSYYGRTSFRQIPRLTRTQLGSGFDVNKDSDRPKCFIDRDERFENDLEHIFGQLLKEFFKKDDERLEIRKNVIYPINEALFRIFAKDNGTRLELVELIPPLEGKIAEINFKKGTSIFHYNQLSAGEKEIFNILINLIARRDYYKNGILFFDELDLHLNTRLQYNVLKEITENWIPENCQFWTASHSLGFIQYAKESEHAIIFDLDDFDFDRPKVMTPEPKDKPDIYQIAVDKDFLPDLFQHFNLIFVENKDKQFYAASKIDNSLFIPENGRNGVYHKVKAGEYLGIVDRDFLTDDDINAIENQYKNLRVLRYYSIENYLYHPDNLEEYYHKRSLSFNKAQYIQKIIEEKNNVKDILIPTLSLKRTEYPYFGEPDFNGKSNQNRFKNKQENFDQSATLSSYLNSSDFEVFYKAFPMKSYATSIEERQHINKSELAKTSWFKNKIESILKTEA